MMPSSPGTIFEVVETELVLQLLVGVFDPPAILDHPNEVLLRRRLGEIGEENLRCGGSPDRPPGDQPEGGQRLGAFARVMSMPHPPDSKPTRHRPLAALPPGHLAEGVLSRESPFGHALPGLSAWLSAGEGTTTPHSCCTLPWGSGGGYVVSAARGRTQGATGAVNETFRYRQRGPSVPA